MATSGLFRVSFTNHGRVYEVYARKIGDAEMLGFVVVEGLVFGERSTVVVDPSEERLRDEFAGVKRFHLPLHSVIRIDEVEKRGPARIIPLEGGALPTATAYPLPGVTGKDRT